MTFDKKLLIPIFLVFIFILAILILPALETNKSTAVAKATSNPSVSSQSTPPSEDTAGGIEAGPEPSAQVVTSDERCFVVSSELTETLNNLWPLADAMPKDFGHPTISYIDIDIANNSSYLTYISTSTLDIQSAIRQYGTAIFGTVPDSSYCSAEVTDRHGRLLNTTLDITETEQTLYVRINFALPVLLETMSLLHDENPWLAELAYEGFTDETVIMEGITRSEHNEITLYKIYAPSQSISIQAFEWYKSAFFDYPSYSDTPKNSSSDAKISFESGGCKIVIYDFTDSDMIKVSITSAQ